MFRKRKWFVYHIAYSHANGSGSIINYRNGKIKTPNDVTVIKERIERTQGVSDVLVINWNELKKAHIDENFTPDKALVI